MSSPLKYLQNLTCIRTATCFLIYQFFIKDTRQYQLVLYTVNYHVSLVILFYFW
jgi:hypothetical protein